MPISKIFFEGISRTPSDRMTEDGGLAESLNLFLDNQETAPALKPDEITGYDDSFEEYGLPPSSEGLDYDVLYIHRGPNYKHFICSMEGSSGLKVGTWKLDDRFNLFIQFDEGHQSAVRLNASDIADVIDDIQDQQGLGLESYPGKAVITSRLANIQGNELIFVGISSQLEDITYLRTNLLQELQAMPGLYDVALTVPHAYLHVLDWFLEIPVDESFRSITSIGNTLIISSDKRMYYALWQDGEYKFLGNEIPDVRPMVFSEQAESQTVLNTLTVETPAGPLAFDEDEEKDYRANDNAVVTIDNIWNSITAALRPIIKEGKVVFPYLFRVAVRLYDGSYVNVTPVIYVAAETQTYNRSGVYQNNVEPYFHIDKTISSDQQTCHLRIGKSIADIYGRTILYPSIIKYQLETTANFSKWSDIVSSVDIFCSGPMYPNTDKYYAKYYSTTGSYHRLDLFPRYGNESVARKYIENYSTFFLAKSVPFEEIESGTFTLDADLTTEHLASQEVLNNPVSHNILLDKMRTYNARVLGSLKAQILSNGLYFINGVDPSNTGDTEYDTYVIFHIKTQAGERLVYSNGPGDDKLLGFSVRAMAFISYPDIRCTKADVYWRTYGEDTYEHREIPMRAFPLTDCAYGFIGFDHWWQETGTQATLPPATDNRFEEIGNKIALSESSNPFFYPSTGRYTIQANKIIDFAAVTSALSQGQFGQFPVYVFTDNGIWTLETNASGTFSTSHLISQDIALDGGVTPIEQAVIFVTAKSVMMIVGSQIKDISPLMNGKPYMLETEVKELLAADAGWTDFIEHEILPYAGHPMKSFLEFMKTAHPVYDYIGRRIIFFSGEIAPEAYVFMLDTETWHRLTTDRFKTPQHAISNAYPDALFQFDGDPGTMVYDLSTPLDIRESETQKGIIVTRTLNLGEPDVFKTITELKIRKDIDADSTVKYILLGSNDGRNFRVLPSLHGRSYKFFKIVILCDIKPYNRISYAEVMWSPRFNNKLR